MEQHAQKLQELASQEKVLKHERDRLDQWAPLMHLEAWRANANRGSDAWFHHAVWSRAV